MHDTVTDDHLQESSVAMPKTPSPSTRAPRGSKPVSQAFFTALDAVPETSRAVVAKAAQGMIKDELKARLEKTKALAAKNKASAPAKAKRAAMPDAKPATAKRRGRKPAEVSPAA